MSRQVTVEVTAGDIYAGTPRSVTDTHPVAMAVRRALGLGWPPRPGAWVTVGDDWFGIKAGGSFYESHDLPAPPGWIRAYDAGQPVEPFTFTFATRWPGHPEMSGGGGRI